jgi:hypothetical protein
VSPQIIGGIIAVLVSIAGGGLFGSYLTHLRLTPKVSAEARQITAAAMDQDWARFQHEIARLVDRCERAEKCADDAIKGQRACEEREGRLIARITQLEYLAAAEGEIKKRAAGVVALDRLEHRGPTT